MARDYTQPLFEKDAACKPLTQFYQWGSMAFWEIQDAGWWEADHFGDVVLLLAHWQLHDNRIATRSGNLGYAVEGLVPAYLIAKRCHLGPASMELKASIDTLLEKLLKLQVEGPLEEGGPETLHSNRPSEVIGGFMSSANDTSVRIDVTQHSAHAILQVLESLDSRAEEPGRSHMRK